MFRTLQSRLTVGFVAIVVAIALALGLGLTLLFNHVLQDQYAASFNTQAQTAALILQDSVGGQFLSSQVQADAVTLSEDFHFRIRVYAENVLVADSDQDPTAAIQAQVKADASGHLAVDGFASIQVPLYVPGYPQQVGTLVASNPLTDRAYVARQFVQTVIWVVLGALLLALVVGGILAQRLTGPLRVLRRAAVRMGEGNLSERVPEGQRMSQSGDEVAELTRQFNRMAARLEQSFATISADRDRLRQFVADVSHEVRTPLTALRTFNDLLRDGAGNDAATRDDFLSESARQIDRLDWLTHNLLDLSRLDAGLTPLALAPADLTATLREAVEANRPAATVRGITLEIDGAPLPVAHDPPRLLQALSNVVGNAVKFSPPGSTVRARTYTDADTGNAVAEVRDEGPGIPQDEAPHVFDRFYRGRDANRAGEGSGLGLAIARAIVEAHGGAIAVVPMKGRGATMRITMPLSRAAAPAPAGVAPRTQLEAKE